MFPTAAPCEPEEGEGDAGFGDPPPAVGGLGGAKLMPLQVQVKRRETERQTEMRLHSHAYLKQLEEEEDWMKLDPVFKNDPFAASFHDTIVSSSSDVGPAGITIPASMYLDSICPIGSQESGGSEGNQGSSAADGNMLSKAQLDRLPLEPRIYALFARGQRTVMRFSRIMHIAPAGSRPEEVVEALKKVAHLVQGCWVACSALRCGGDARREHVRDHILLQFSRGTRMQTDAFG